MKLFTINNAKPCSGAEEHQLELSGWMRKQGVEVTFLVRDVSKLGDKAAEAGFKTERVFAGGIKNLLSIPAIFKVLLADSPDILSLNREHTIYPVFLASLLAAPFLDKKPKLVAVLHSPTGRRYPVLRYFDGVICTSRYTAEAFIPNNPFLRDKMEIIHCGINIFEAEGGAKGDRNRPRRYFKDRGFPLIGMVGELWKNQEELVDVAGHLLGAFPDITIAVIGGGSNAAADSLREKIRTRGLERNFILTGRVERSRMPDVFHDLDLSVSTHRNEGFGIVHIESLAAFTPVVAYNSGGLTEILAKGGGAVVDGGSYEFSQTVVHLLSDDEKRRALGVQGRKVAEESFSVEVMGNNHLKFYEKLLS